MFNTESTAVKLLKAELKAQKNTLKTLEAAYNEQTAVAELRKEVDQNAKRIKTLKSELGLN